MNRDRAALDPVAPASTRPVARMQLERGLTVTDTHHVSRIHPPYQPIVEVDAEYSRLPIAAGFNWQAAFADVDRGEWYLVVFRSQHRADADHAYLTWLDEQASHAASRHPGFLYYFIGTPRDDGRCLSFCLWQSRQDALAAAADPEHREAMMQGLPFFMHYRLERYQVSKHDGDLRLLPLPHSAPSTLPTTVHSDPAWRDLRRRG